MENLLQQHTVCMSRSVIDRQEECGVSGSFTLPDYCSDMAAVLTCTMVPHLQSRQWSGDRLLIDGAADVRVLYLDEDRCCIHSAEFSLPFSLEVKCDGVTDSVPVSVDLSTRYVNWRVVSPRCIEIRGAVTAGILAQTTEEIPMAEVISTELEAKTCPITVTAPAFFAEKVITVSEQLDFPQMNPSADMLLGGECCLEMTECRVLNAKAIVKGVLHVHQLYTDNGEKGTTHCLSYAVPFSQIIDADGATENQLHSIRACILSDTERCLVGADGENTVLDVTAKILLQLCIWQREETTVLLDAYHTKYPVSLHHNEFEHSAYQGYRLENTVLPVPCQLPSGDISEVVDVWTKMTECDTTVAGQKVAITGKLQISVLYRDCDKHVCFYQNTEDFRMDSPCSGDKAQIEMNVVDTQYRMDGACLQLQVKMNCHVKEYVCCNHRIITDIQVQTDRAFDSSDVNLMMYYAHSGDSVWEIGRHCHASARYIAEENGLTDDRLDKDCLLTIPL